MRSVGFLVALALVMDLPVIAPADAAQTVPLTLSSTAASHAVEAQSPLLADCTETATVPAPLPPRPTLRRATFAHALPRHARPKRRAPVRHTVHKRRAAAHHARPRHPVHQRPLLRRVTYASPLCEKRSEAINDMLGLPAYEVTQPPIAADSVPGDAIPALVDQPPLIGPGPSPIVTGGGGPIGPGPIVTDSGGPTGPGPITFPGGPIFPTGPGPIVIVPPGPPTVTPPAVSNVPEPASWATMLIGMALVGGACRRRRRRTSVTQ